METRPRRVDGRVGEVGAAGELSEPGGAEPADDLEAAPSPPTVEVVADASQLAAAAAERIAAALAAAVARRGTASIALSGGSTPLPAYRLLAAPPLRERIAWPAVEVFWGDERAVPPDHADSNYRAAEAALLRHVPIDPGRVHRLRGELDPTTAARLYEEEMILSLAEAGGDGEPPSLDLVLLGLGADGHTASLFPAAFAGHEGELDFDPHPGRMVAAATAPSEPRRRVTLTLSSLRAARRVLFLAAGDAKAEAVARTLAARPPLTPAARVRPWHGETSWLLDRAAAGPRAGERGEPR